MLEANDDSTSPQPHTNPPAKPTGRQPKLSMSILINAPGTQHLTLLQYRMGLSVFTDLRY